LAADLVCNDWRKSLFSDIEDKVEYEQNPKGAGFENDSAGHIRGSGHTNMSMGEFRRIYDSAFPVLFRVAYRITNSEEAAEDLCQESFFRLYEKNMVFPNPEQAKYWLIRVVKNAALNYAKRRERERKAYQRAFREDTRQVETGEVQFVKKETRAEIQEALNKLPENMKMALVFKEYAEMNYKEIGRVLGISEGNVKVRVFRARERLAVLLQGGSDVS
jgi:RNA polymerase sigma-70 factor (ECF subfamily)